MARKSTGKRLRFEIFKRDGFRCVYCGATPVQKPLHLDHVVPLGDVRPQRGAMVESVREQAEQIREYLAVQKEIAAAKALLVEAIEDRRFDCVGPRLSDQLAGRFGSMVEDLGFEKVLEAISITARRNLTSPTDQTKYFCGIIRRMKAGG